MRTRAREEKKEPFLGFNFIVVYSVRSICSGVKNRLTHFFRFNFPSFSLSTRNPFEILERSALVRFHAIAIGCVSASPTSARTTNRISLYQNARLHNGSVRKFIDHFIECDKTATMLVRFFLIFFSFYFLLEFEMIVNLIDLCDITCVIADARE